MGINLSGFGTFAGGMAKGIESGVGLVGQYEDIERKRRRRDAAADLSKVGDYETFADANETAIPMSFTAGAEGALAPPGGNPLAPAMPASAIPDVMTAGGTKRPTFADYRAKKLAAYSAFAEDNPEIYMAAEAKVEQDRRGLLTNAIMQARTASAEDATRIMNDAYETFISEGGRPGNMTVVLDPTDPKNERKLVKVGDSALSLEEVMMSMQGDPKMLTDWIQSERGLAQKDRQIGQQDELIELKGDELADRRREVEDTARFRMEQLGIQRVDAEGRLEYYSAMRARALAEGGEAHAKAVSDGFKSVSAAESDYRTDLQTRDSEFAGRFGHTVGVVADALVEADPTKSGRQYLHNAEWMVRTRDPEAFKRLMETDPGIADRWAVELPDGTRTPAYEIRPDGGADIKVFTAPIVDDNGETVGRYDFIIDPTTGSKQRLTPELRSVFDRLETGNIGPGAPGAPAAPGAPGGGTDGAIPEPASPGASAGQFVRDVGSASGQWLGVLMDLNHKYGGGPWVRFTEDFGRQLLGMPPAQREEYIVRNLPGVGQSQVAKMVEATREQGGAIPPDRIEQQRGR